MIMRFSKSLMLVIGLSFFFCQIIQAGSIVYVAPDGCSTNDGSKEKPLGLGAALKLAETDPQLTEIILTEGRYQGHYYLGKPKYKDNVPVLKIRALDGQKPILYNSIRIQEATPVPGIEHLFAYKTDRDITGPAMWEKSTRIHYRLLSNRASVAAIPGSFFYDADAKIMYFRTDSDKPPKDIDLYMGLNTSNVGLYIYRPNTIIDGLHFVDYCGPNKHGIVTHAAKVTIRNCYFENISTGWCPGVDSPDNICEDCIAKDVTMFMFGYGENTIVRRNRLEKTRDRFLQPVTTTWDNGIYFYFPAKSATIEYNFIKGYNFGCRIKTNNDKFIIRHNTIIDAAIEGISYNHPQPGSETHHNIIVNSGDFIRDAPDAPTIYNDYNLVWHPLNPAAFFRRNSTIRGDNTGKFNILADPRFADPENGDYRLLPDSPALKFKDKDGNPMGAMGVAPVEAGLKTPPQLEVLFEADSRACGRYGELTLERDPWIGGGKTLIRQLRDEEGMEQRVTGRLALAVDLYASDISGKITKMQIKIGKEPGEEIPYSYHYSVKLPDKDGEYPLSFAVQNDKGIWSKPVKALVRLDRVPPQLVDKPIVSANDFGVLVQFQTAEPCFATIQYGSTTNYGGVIKTPQFINRDWDANEGGEWIETWEVPADRHALAILQPKVKTGETVHLQILLEDQGGLESKSQDYEVKVTGKARTIYVSPTGRNEPGAGLEQNPLGNIQSAVDQALPGDRILLLPGVYPKAAYLTHGGVSEDARLTIEAANPDEVTIDSAKRQPSLFALEGAEFVTLRNLRLLYFTRAAVYAYRSPHLTFDRCVVFNGSHYVTGQHVFAFYSPHAMITRSLLIGGEGGICLLESPFATITNNTISQGMFNGINFIFSLKGSRLINNSIGFGMNECVSGEMHHPDELKTFYSDYNNLGTDVTTHNRPANIEKDQPELWKQVLAEEFKIDYPGALFSRSSKGIVSIGKRYLTMKDWREFSGNDKHSLFADPKYVRPWLPIDTWNWSLKPDSPNLGKGEKGADIGALGLAK